MGDPEPAPPARRAGGKVQAWSDRQDGGSQVEEWLAEMGRTSQQLSAVGFRVPPDSETNAHATVVSKQAQFLNVNGIGS